MFGQADRPIMPGPVSGQCLSQIRIRQKRNSTETDRVLHHGNKAPDLLAIRISNENVRPRESPEA